MSQIQLRIEKKKLRYANEFSEQRILHRCELEDMLDEVEEIRYKLKGEVSQLTEEVKCLRMKNRDANYFL